MPYWLSSKGILESRVTASEKSKLAAMELFFRIVQYHRKCCIIFAVHVHKGHSSPAIAIAIWSVMYLDLRLHVT